MIERYINENGHHATSGGKSWLDGRTTQDDATDWRIVDIASIDNRAHTKLRHRFTGETLQSPGVDVTPSAKDGLSLVSKAFGKIITGAAITGIGLALNAAAADNEGYTPLGKLAHSTEITLNGACADLLSASAPHFTRTAC